MKAARPPKAVLFDLEGTLLDTAPDMAGALNVLRNLEGLAELPFSDIRPHVSHGAARLIEIGFSCTEGARFDDLRSRFLELYRHDLAARTRLFPGLEPVLDGMDVMGISWGIVTNKPAWLTEPLVDALGLRPRLRCIVSGDTLPRRKPHPDPLLHAARQMGCVPAECLYVGDAERDVLAGRAAGMRMIVAGFGYIGPGEDPSAWQADAIVAEPAELALHLGMPDMRAAAP